MKDSVRAIGLMSGTSMDGVDIAMIETDGRGYVAAGPSGFRPYTDAERALLRHALSEARDLQERASRPGVLADAEAMITAAHAEAVEQFLVANAIGRSDIAVVGFHGQTVLHRPEIRLTVQIGDGEALARRLAIPVVYDFRADDVAAGGQGAPLVPIYHQALIEAAQDAGADLGESVAVLNLGGVANVTLVRIGNDPVACDTGPANALIDDFMLERTGRPVDLDGAAGARGVVDQAVLAALMANPFFGRPLPKSLDRNAFDRTAVNHLSTEDGAATLTAFTAQATAAIIPHLGVTPDLWIACGGGARNPTLLKMLSDAMAAPVISADSLGWSADALEAQAFAYLAVRSLQGLPLSFPTTTGAPRPMRGGRSSGP